MLYSFLFDFRFKNWSFHQGFPLTPFWTKWINASVWPCNSINPSTTSNIHIGYNAVCLKTKYSQEWLQSNTDNYIVRLWFQAGDGNLILLPTNSKSPYEPKCTPIAWFVITHLIISASPAWHCTISPASWMQMPYTYLTTIFNMCYIKCHYCYSYLCKAER